MKRRFTAISAIALLALTASPARSATQGCLDLLEVDGVQSGQRSDALARYASFYKCLNYSDAASEGFASLRLQLTTTAQAYLSKQMPYPAYRAFIVDRQRKAELMRKKPEIAEAIARGDSDGDLVPDADDKCAGTKALAPTDAQGCELKCPTVLPAGSLGRGIDPACLAALPLPGASEYDPFQPGESTIPINLSCDDVAPATSAPIAWGRRSFEISNTDSEYGNYFSLRRTSDQADGCEVWYALQFTLRQPRHPDRDPVEIVSVLFSSADDLTRGDPIARFPIMDEHWQRVGDQVYVTYLPLSPGRKQLRDALRDYSEVSIRVRVITGAQQASAWSASVTIAQGPMISK